MRDSLSQTEEEKTEDVHCYYENGIMYFIDEDGERYFYENNIKYYVDEDGSWIPAMCQNPEKEDHCGKEHEFHCEMFLYYLKEKNISSILLLIEKEKIFLNEKIRGKTLIHYFAEYNLSGIFESLSGWCLDSVDDSGKTPFMTAIDHSRIRCYEHLFDENNIDNIFDYVIWKNSVSGLEFLIKNKKMPKNWMSYCNIGECSIDIKKLLFDFQRKSLME